MVIEWLEFRTSPERREDFVQLDFEIWDPFLKAQAGFVRKEIWLDAADRGRIAIAVEWSDRDLWKSIPESQISERTEAFGARFGDAYDLVSSQEFQVRKR
ncbi:MAG: TIGR03792 family protein [Geitlerinemataceae cyanobacterium]